VTPNDVLTVLNDGQPFDLDGCEFAVASAPADTRYDYGARRLVEEPSWFPFTPGEILVVGLDGREPFGEGRHCRKWGVEFEYFRNLAGALACRARVPADAEAVR
jgi:hypothetical protein